MAIKLGEELSSSDAEPKLTMTILLLPGYHHHHKPPQVTGVPPLTPPLHPMASVPFQWEEAPGKPRRLITNELMLSPITKPKSARSLDLDPPPARLSLEKGSNLITTNLHLAGRGKTGARREEESGKCGCYCGDKREVVFDESKVTVEISRLRRKGSLCNLTHSRLFGSVCGRLKQMVCRRRSNPNHPNGENENRCGLDITKSR